MKKELKSQIIESISAQLQQYPNFYLTNIEGLNAENTVKLRRACFDEGIKLNVVKNTLFAHVIKGIENEELQNVLPLLEGNTAVMFSESPTPLPSSSRSSRRISARSRSSRARTSRSALSSELTSSRNSALSSPRKNSSETSSPSSRLLCATSFPLSRMVADRRSPVLSRLSRKKNKNINNKQFKNYQLWQM